MCSNYGVCFSPLGVIFEVLVFKKKRRKKKKKLALFMMLHESLQLSLYYLETQAQLIQ